MLSHFPNIFLIFIFSIIFQLILVYKLIPYGFFTDSVYSVCLYLVKYEISTKFQRNLQLEFQLKKIRKTKISN